jgi:hypothetical protein
MNLLVSVCIKVLRESQGLSFEKIAPTPKLMRLFDLAVGLNFLK